MSVNRSARLGSIIRIYFRFTLHGGMLCVLIIESPHRGDSNEYTQYTIIDIKIKSHRNIQNIIMSAAIGLFPRHSKTSSK